MRWTNSWEKFGVAPKKMAALVSLLGAAPAVAVALVAAPFLGQLSLVLGAVVGMAAAYSVAAMPKRALEKSALVQAREAPTLAASGAVYLNGTGSKAKTVLMLRSDEPMLSSVIRDMKRETLLGFDPTNTLKRSEALVQSQSSLSVLRSIVRAQGERLEDQGEELESIVRSSASGEETKFPVFMTIAFFLPIMLMLFAALEHHSDPLAMVSLAFIEVVVLDLALSISSTERRKLSA
ncbi:MAG: hypothetical protein OK456_07255 [Thaumarchaeota archaeon]|nr:hypothetical protein [Nitrososphaerota archaeon]